MKRCLIINLFMVYLRFNIDINLMQFDIDLAYSFIRYLFAPFLILSLFWNVNDLNFL